MKKACSVFFGIALLLSQSVFGGTAGLKQRMFADLETIKNFIEVKYAPLDWKKKYVNLDLDSELAAAKQKLDALDNPSVKDFQVVLKDFLNATKDYHVNAHYYSTEQAMLPFTIKGAEGHYFIVHINRSKAPLYSFPFEVGDELITFDNRPVQEVVDELKIQELGRNNEETDQSLAELLLTIRRGEMGIYVPHGPVKLAVKRKKDGKVKDALVHWDYFPEKIKDIVGLTKPYAKNFLQEEEDLVAFFKKSLSGKMMVNSVFDQNYLKDVVAMDASNPYLVGARNSFLPPFGKVVWKGNKNLDFEAYIFEGPKGKKIGYLRIPHYMCDEPEAREFQEIINNFQKRTDALVIDQLHNAGGSVFYLYALVSMLTDKPMTTPKHRIALTQEEVYLAVSMLPLLEMIQTDIEAKIILGKTIGGYPVSMDVVRQIHRFFKFIINEWNAGHFITDPTFVYIAEQIMPSPRGAYTKPIVMLINELDYSCGDFFPAIMKDNQRATLIGTRTAGAGGYVYNASFPNNMGIEYLSLTGSIAERDDHSMIENLGVTPHLFYTFTAKDVTGDYEGFKQVVLDALEKQLSQE